MTLTIKVSRLRAIALAILAALGLTLAVAACNSGNPRGAILRDAGLLHEVVRDIVLVAVTGEGFDLVLATR